MQNKLNDVSVVTLNVSSELSINVLPSHEHSFMMTTTDVAKGYGISRDTIHSHKHENPTEFTEGVHFVKGIGNTKTLQIKNAQPNAIYWTKAGIIRLGFFVRSERAKMFRDWAESVILEYMEPKVSAPKVELPKAKRGNHNRLSKDRLVDILSLVALVDEKEVRTALVKKLMPDLDIPAIQLQLPFEAKGGVGK